jgi:hypothetical protein
LLEFVQEVPSYSSVADVLGVGPTPPKANASSLNPAPAKSFCLAVFKEFDEVQLVPSYSSVAAVIGGDTDHQNLKPAV